MLCVNSTYLTANVIIRQYSYSVSERHNRIWPLQQLRGTSLDEKQRARDATARARVSSFIGDGARKLLNAGIASA